jgi:hypothetical protein
MIKKTGMIFFYAFSVINVAALVLQIAFVKSSTWAMINENVIGHNKFSDGWIFLQMVLLAVCIICFALPGEHKIKTHEPE